MPKANGSYVKVYLYALSLAAQGRSMTAAQIADKLSMIESDIINAFAYWERNGALKQTSSDIIFPDDSGGIPTVSLKDPDESFSFLDSLSAAPAHTAVRPNISTDTDAAVPQKKSYVPGEISAQLCRNKPLSEMLNVTQQLLGKPLNTSDTETLYWFYDGLKLPVEVILMIVEYCVGINKLNMSFIEKIAIEWKEKNIVTIEAAEKYLEEKQQVKQYSSSLKKIMGISDRALVPKEEEFLDSWRTQYNMSEDMVALAYEYCVIQINKLSFPYMDKIIKRWHSQGIFTIADAEADHNKYRDIPKKTEPAPDGSGFNLYSESVDHNSIEDLMNRTNE